MDKDLEWLAKNIEEWREQYLYARRDKNFSDGICWSDADRLKYGYGWITRAQWLQARKDLGLVMSDEEEEMQAPEWSGEEAIKTSIKQLRYMDSNGEDWIDEFARTASVDEFRGAMRFTIGKYNRRAGKKDELVKEIEKMRDYCERWLAYERNTND